MMMMPTTITQSARATTRTIMDDAILYLLSGAPS